MDNTVWTSYIILNWHSEYEGGTYGAKEFWELTYKIWEHSKNPIENTHTDFNLTDGITNLKRL
jgi:hypothetical protein